MFNARRVWLLLPNWVRRVPPDLAIVILVEAVTAVSVLVGGSQETPLHVLVGLPFAFFFPGYALTTALFPTRGTRRTSDGQADEGASALDPNRGIDWLQRLTLSASSSVVVVSLIGLGLSFSEWGIQSKPLFASISAFTITTAALATVRRWRVPSAERFAVPYLRWYSSLKFELFRGESRAGRAVSIVLALSFLLAGVSAAYGLAFTPRGESFTEFYLLTEQPDGDLTASDYPTSFERGEQEQLIVGIENFEQATTEYTVLVELQRVSTGNSDTRILESRTLHRFQTTLDPSEQWRLRHSVSPTMTGENLRLQYRLYRGDVSRDATAAEAYEEVHLWVNVTSPSASAKREPPSPSAVSRPTGVIAP